MTKDSEKIYRELRRQIVTMRLKPKSKLCEEDLAKIYKISRTPIRDVLKKLEHDGLLEVHPKKGSFVTTIDLSEVTDDMYIRSSVEYQVMLDLMKYATPGDIMQLTMMIDDQSKLFDINKLYDKDEFARNYYNFDNNFHAALYGKVNKLSVLEIINTTRPCYARYRFLTYLRDEIEIENLFEIHRKLVDCIQLKDKDMLSKIVTEHNFSGLNGIEKVREAHPEYFA